MVKIFSYKNLHDVKVQKDTFGVVFDGGGVDLVDGFDFEYKKIGKEEYRIAFYTGLKKDIIMGEVVIIPNDYLEIIDDYEGDLYKRIPVITCSGNECQMYVKK